MKIYLASNYTRHPEMRIYTANLEALGHVVTSRWIQGGHDSLLPEKCALDDLEDLQKADCCISFTCEPGKPQGRNRGGRHVEFGYALARGYRLIVVGWRENVFHCMPQVEFYPQYSDLMLQMAREFEESERHRIEEDIRARHDTYRSTDRVDSLALWIKKELNS